jgi:tetratricopeptide (TPR) repeat protein
MRGGEMSYTITELRESLGRYEGHPYALQGALDMIATGTKLEELPDDTTETGIVEEQWSKICGYGEDAIHLFKAYAILEEAVPDEIVDNVAEIKADTRLTLLAKNVFLDKLLYGEGDSKRIYHLLLAKYILNQMNEKEQKDYHSRAVEIYREKLSKAKEEQIRPDALAATRLAEHVLAAEGKEAFIDSFLSECGEALMNLGLFDTFISLSERALGMVEKDSKEEAMVTGNLGRIYRTKGDLAKAEEMHNKSLEIAEKLGLQEGMANAYNNLGIIYETKGDLDKAKEMHNKSLEIAEKLGLQERMADAYSNLGIIYRTKGDLDKAKEMHNKSLEIEKKSGRLEGMARQYSNLGIIYQKKDDLDKAEDMHNKSLEIAEKLGLQEGMASEYGNLGLIYLTKGDLAKAEDMHNKSLEIAEKLGHKEIMASEYGNLGIFYETKGDLDKAKEMHNKSLEINKKLGRLEGMASNYGNLGLIYRTKGNLNKAEEMHNKSLEISKKLERLEGMANQYGNLGLIYKQRGDIGKAREYWEQAVELYKRIGMLHMVEKIEKWISELED